MQHKHANTLLKNLAFPLLSGFGLWNQMSSVVRQKGGSSNLCSFFSRSALFFLLVFLCTPALFFALRLREWKREKHQPLLIMSLQKPHTPSYRRGFASMERESPVLVDHFLKHCFVKFCKISQHGPVLCHHCLAVC
jgi:hypothetical protein